MQILEILLVVLLFVALLAILFLFSFKIIIRAYNNNTDICVLLSIKFLYFFYIENAFIYCRKNGVTKKYLFGLDISSLKIGKKKKRKKGIKLGVKELRIKILYGNKDAVITALTVGALQSALSIISAAKYKRIFFDVVPVFNESEFKIILDGVVQFKTNF